MADETTKRYMQKVPKNVYEKQIYYQSITDKFTHLKGPYDKYVSVIIPLAIGTTAAAWALLLRNSVKIFPNCQCLLPYCLYLVAMSSSDEKDVYNIQKFDGINFAIWKEQIQDVLIQKGQLGPIMERLEGEYTDIEWQKLDAKAKSTICLHLAEFVYFTIVGERTARDVCDKLCSSYENKSATNKVFLMKKLFDLCMKEEGTISTHINEFNIIFTQLTSQGLVFDEEINCTFLLCSLPLSWDTFCIAISNSVLGIGLVYNDILGSLFIEEISRKFLKGKKDSDAYVANDRQRSRTQSRAKSNDHGGSHSKSWGSMCNVEC
ncbi:hypothetical protein L7F22_013581 [Adiantum nelumboides]|nr:hypothetical protein [Adiantum nelumboides]